MKPGASGSEEPVSGDPNAAPEILRRHRGLVGRTALVAAFTLLSRLLGFVREVVMAFVFGDKSAVSDAFFTAWRVPNLFRRLFGEGALSTSLQTSLTEADANSGAQGRELFKRTLTLTLAILVLITGVSMFAVSYLPDAMPITGWAWMGTDPAPVRDLAVRLMPYVVFVCLAALSGGALQVRGHYRVPNLAPVVMNVAWIGALLWVGYVFGWAKSAEESRAVVLARQWDMARLLAWGVLLGGLVQLAIHIPPLLRYGLLRGPGVPRTEGSGPTAWTVLKTSAPLAVGAAVYQINVMIDGLMAEGLLADGGPSALYYANRVQQFPLALVAVAAVNSVFPALKAHGHLGDLRAVRELHDRAQFGVLFLALPAAVGLAVLAEPIARVLFEHGNYSESGVQRIAAGLRMLAIALIPVGAVGLLGRTYYALGDFRTPVRVSIWMMLVNVLLNTLLVAGLGMDVEGLALATAITSWGNLGWLLLGLRKGLGLPLAIEAAGGRLLRMLVCAAASGAAAWGTHRLWSVGGPSLALGAAIVAGALAYWLGATLSGIPELKTIRRRGTSDGSA